jgi:predicted nucleotidyltransferase
MADPLGAPIPSLAALRAKRDEILAIASACGAHNVRVTGSVAAGEAGPDSDIDLVVDLDDDRDVADLSNLILDLEEALGRRVDVLEVRHPSAFAARVLGDAVPL